MLQTEDFIVAPGVYDGFSARIAHEVGFKCIYMVCFLRGTTRVQIDANGHRLVLALLPRNLVNPILVSPPSTTCASTQR